MNLASIELWQTEEAGVVHLMQLQEEMKRQLEASDRGGQITESDVEKLILSKQANR